MKKLFSIFLSMILITGCSTTSTPDKEVSNNIKSQVTYINVGQGDSTLIQNNNQTVLIDAGHGDGYENASLNYLKEHYINTLDALILTHCDADHINEAKNIIYQLNVKKIYMSSRTSSSYTYMKLLNAIKEKKKNITVPKVGDTFQVGAGSIEFIGVGEGAQNNNDSSLCMRYYDGYHRFVFTGDAAESMEKKLNKVQCDVFQAGHHGSAYSNSDNLLSRMKASYVVVSCGKDNMYGHPHKEALQRFSRYDMVVYRTDELGTIRCVSKKNKLTFNGKEEITTTQTTQYIGSRNTKKYHREDCQYVKTISDKNKVYFSSSQEAQKEGYIPCKACNP
ncbi:ComEC/Rec2 family competence protein [Catenibacterium mitsuokai]|uniref:ComEC/Rec2 family competence protein n=1 Tax=Catenibacterium mitsuokai TaxID=100886 RepID=UPI003F89E245